MLRTVTTLTNTTGGPLDVVLFESYDPTQGGIEVTHNDVLTVNGIPAAQAVGFSNTHTSILGSQDPSVVGFIDNNFLGIIDDSILGGFLTSPYDPNGTQVDISYNIAFQTTLGAGDSASFTVLHAFGKDVSAAQNAFTEATTTVTAMPEPGTLALLGLVLAGLGLARRRKTT